MGVVAERIQDAEAEAVREIEQVVKDSIDHAVRNISGIPSINLREWIQGFDNKIDLAYPKLAVTIAGRELLTPKEKRKVPYFHKKKDKTDFLLLAFAVGVVYVLGRYDSVANVPLSAVDSYIRSYKKWPVVYRDLLRNHRAMYLTDIEKALTDTRSNVRGAARSHIYDHADYPMITNNDWRDQTETFPTVISGYVDGWMVNMNASTQYRSTEALNHAIAATAMMERAHVEMRVYFDVQPDACEACVRAYLTDSHGSTPKRFSMEELLQNGTNEGKRRAQWRPVAGAMHPNCRCTMHIEYLTEQDDLT